MVKLLTSLGYAAEAFPSAADFLASPLLTATACLVSDVQMPGMTGVELHRRLIDAGHPIPTILVTAYPDEVVRRRALKDGVVCYLRKRWMTTISNAVFARLSNPESPTRMAYESSWLAGRVN
jgi:FixJ family two-component response regulator